MTEYPERASVQAEFHGVKKGSPGEVPGTITWAEHVEAWNAYDKRFRNGQSAFRIHQRSGFGYLELTELLGHPPATWEPLQRWRPAT